MRRTVAWLLAAVGAAAAFLLPLITMVTGSLRKPGLPPPRGFEALPDPVTLGGYRAAFELAPLGRSLLNSALLAAVFVPLAVLSASWTGFAIAQAGARARRWLVAIVLLLMTVPVTALWIARFAIFEALGLTGTYVPLVVPALMGGSPLAVLLYVFAFRRIPRDVYDAAHIEGSGPLRTWRRVAMPMVKGTTAAVAMLGFVQSWSGFIDPLLYLDRERTFTAPLALRYLEQLGQTNWPVLLAGSVVVTVPAAAVFLLAQRTFLRERIAP